MMTHAELKDKAMGHALTASSQRSTSTTVEDIVASAKVIYDFLKEEGD